MDPFLRKYMWAVHLAVIASCTVFLARAAASAVESRIDIPAPRSSPHPVHAAAAYAKDVEPILTRNMFCSTCKAEVAIASPDTGPRKTSLPLALIAVMFSPRAAEWSMAVVRDTGDRSLGAFAVGGKLRTATITRIEETRVHLDNGEFLDLLEAPAATLATTVPALARDPQEIEIKKTGEHSYELQRSTLESLLGNTNVLSRAARAFPEVRDGKPVGFRFSAVRPEGPLGKIGIQNGDVLFSINGLEITAPEKALDAYTKLRSASHVSLGLERNGQKITKDYSIR